MYGRGSVLVGRIVGMISLERWESAVKMDLEDGWFKDVA
jgi:hypothetical protein